MPDSYTWNVVADATTPAIVLVIGMDANRIRVIFSEPMVESEALATSNYVFTGGLTVAGVTKETATAYIVTTSNQTPNTTYQLTVSNVHDLYGNTI